ncbi:MAG: ABC transporter ATP-binding protein [Actinomycetota bacterium]
MTATDPAGGTADERAVVVARGLGKRYGDFAAVDGIDFEIRPGEAFGFLGPNGAGKSSTMRMVGCVSPRTSGDLEVFGLDPSVDGSAIRARLGVVPQDDTLDIGLNVRDNLIVYARFFGIPRAEAGRRADELLDFIQLRDRARDPVEPLSGGMKRRLTIARALVNRPDLVLLDEPTTGLDPQARHLLWERLYRLKQRGATLVLTTHYMDEAEQLCDRLVIMDGGRIADEGSPRELIQRHCPRDVVELRFADGDRLTEAARTMAAGGHHVEPLPDRLLVYADDGDRVVDQVETIGVNPTGSLVRRSTLEDVFLRLTGRSLVEA